MIYTTINTLCDKLSGHLNMVIGESSPLALEPINLSFSEMSNLWSVCGGTYYPSMLCKLRVLSVNSNEIRGISRLISEKEISIGKKPKKYNPYRNDDA